MIPISLCIITKNEEKNLDRCLSCIKDYPFEIVVVDTGSTDHTVEIAKKYTDNVYHFDWINDFAAARNFSISKASNDWILVLDADEFTYELDLEEIYHLIEQHPTGIGRLLRSSEDIIHSVTIDRVERLFNRNVYHYERPIHEQVLPIDKKTKLYTYPIPLATEHAGYMGTREDINKKAMRNLEILLASEKDYPDAYTYYQIGQSYFIMSDWEKARIYFEKGLSFPLAPESEFVQLMVVNFGYSLLHVNRLEDAVKFFEEIYSYFDFYADFVFLMGYIYMKSGNYMKSALNFIKATTLSCFHVEGANSFLAYYHLGIVYEMIGNAEMALMFYEKAGDYPKAVEQVLRLKKTPE
nr:glycosyltransferase [Lachnospiraceae bacterium]